MLHQAKPARIIIMGRRTSPSYRGTTTKPCLKIVLIFWSVAAPKRGLHVPCSRAVSTKPNDALAIVVPASNELKRVHLGCQFLSQLDQRSRTWVISVSPSSPVSFAPSYRRILDDVVLLSDRPGSCVRIFACGGSILDLLAFHHCDSVDSRSFSA